MEVHIVHHHDVIRVNEHKTEKIKTLITNESFLNKNVLKIQFNKLSPYRPKRESSPF